jgi:hypothetical protein
VGAEIQEKQEKLVHGMSYSHPWIPTFILTYTTSYDALDAPEEPSGTFGGTNFPEVLEIEAPFGPERFKFYLRDFRPKEWVQLTDSEGNEMPAHIWHDPFQGLWCKWLKPTGPQ